MTSESIQSKFDISLEAIFQKQSTGSFTSIICYNPVQFSLDYKIINISHSSSRANDPMQPVGPAVKYVGSRWYESSIGRMCGNSNGKTPKMVKFSDYQIAYYADDSVQS